MTTCRSSCGAITGLSLPSPAKRPQKSEAQMRSFNDESRFTVHTAAEVLFVFQDGEEVR